MSIETVDVPAAPFSPTSLRGQLRPLDLDGPRYLSADEQRYLDHYGIRLDREFAGLDQRIGYLDVASSIPGRAASDRIAVQVLRPLQPKGTAFVVHGYFDHVGIFGHLLRYALRKHLNVVAFDLPGHGLSSGAPATIDSFDRYVHVLETCLSALGPALRKPWDLFGQSMGGAVVMEHLLRQGFTRRNSPYRNLVLFAPLVRPYRWSLLRFVYYGAHRWLDTWPRGFQSNSGDEEFVSFLRDRDPLQATAVAVPWVAAMVAWMHHFRRYRPTDLAPIVIQGDADKTVDAGYNLAMVSKLFQARILHLPDAGHHLVNETAALRAQMFALIDGEAQF